MHFIAKKTLQQQPLQKVSPVAIFCVQNNEGGLNELYRFWLTSSSYLRCMMLMKQEEIVK